MNKLTAVAILASTLIIGGAVLFIGRAPQGSLGTADNVTMVDGTQIVEIAAKGGFSPEKTVARAGVPTIIRFTTNGTFDCSSAVRIPSMGITKNLPPSGTTEVELGSPDVAILQGMCGMGMYSFQIDFRG